MGGLFGCVLPAQYRYCPCDRNASKCFNGTDHSYSLPGPRDTDFLLTSLNLILWLTKISS